MPDIDPVAAFEPGSLLGRPSHHSIDIQFFAVRLARKASKGRRPQCFETSPQQAHRTAMGGQCAGHTLIRAAVGCTLNHAAPVDAMILKPVIPFRIATNPFTPAVALDRLCFSIDGE